MTDLAQTNASITTEEDGKTAATANSYFVVLDSDNLKAPAIFLNFDDCNFYIDEEDNEKPVSYREFHNLDDAHDYIQNFLGGSLSKDLPTKKRPAKATSLATQTGTPRKRGRPKGKRVNLHEGVDFVAMMENMKEYKDKNLPIKSNVKLQGWIAKQRKEYQNFKDGQPSTMTVQRIAQLADNGFNFEPKKTFSWDERAIQWLEYRSQHGKDPKRYSEDGLGKWVVDQKAKYRALQRGEKTNLTTDQVKRLSDWGFTWESKIKIPANAAKKQSWEFRYGQLVTYKEKNGNCLVPQHYPELGQWVHSQRTNYRKYLRNEKSSMTKERFDKLKALGFVFNTERGGGKRNVDNEDFASEEEVEDTLATNLLSARRTHAFW